MTGRPPFHTGDIAQQAQHVTPAPLEQRLKEFGLQNELPDYVNDVVMSCLAKDATTRPTSVGAIGEWIRTEGKSDRPAERKKTETGIERMVAEKPGQAVAEPAAPEQPAEKQPEVAGDKKSPVLAIAAAFIVVAGLSWIFMGGFGDQDENQNQDQGLQPAGSGTGKTGAEKQAGIADSLKKGLVAYYPFNGNANDESGNGNDGEVKGATLTEDRHGKSNSAYEFDGEDDLINVQEKPEFEENAHTISLWFKSDAAKGLTIGRVLICKDGDGPGRQWNVAELSGLRVQGHVWVPDGMTDIESTLQYGIGAWCHVMQVWDGRTLKLYVDGVFDSEKPAIGPIDPGPAPVLIGGLKAINLFHGSIDDVRIYNRALSADEITALYDLEKPKTDLKKGLVAYYPFNGNAKDESGNGLDGEVKGATLATDRNGAARRAYRFDGDDYINLGNKPQFNFKSGDFSISTWIRSPSYEGNQYLVGKYGGSNPGYGLGIRPDPESRIYAFIRDDIGGGWADIKSEAKLDQQNWHHVVATYDRTGSLVIYIDGAASGAVGIEKESGSIDDKNQNLTIGLTSGFYFKGSIDDVRIYNRALSAEEITALYDLEKPKTDLKKGLVAYFPFNGNAKDESGNGHDGKVTGATPATDRHGKANRAYAFPSKDDFISVPEAPGFEGNAHTISMWFNSDATKALSQGTVFMCKDNGSQRQWQVAEVSNRRVKALVWTSEGMKTINSKAQYNIGQWHQLTQTWDGKKLGLYIDGKLDAEVPATGPLTAGDQPILIGAQGGYAFKGSLDDIRFYNRALAADEITALYNLEKPSGHASVTPNSPEAAAAIEAAIRKAVGKPSGELTKADLAKVTHLTLSNNQLTDVSALSGLTQLTVLYLTGNRVTDVSALKELKQLTHLRLDQNKISDLNSLVSALKELKQLTVLWLDDNQLTDVSALKELKQLTDLGLSKNRISDMSALKELKQLRWLQLSHNQISDVSPLVSALKELKQLEELNLSDNQISDTDPLKELTRLMWLHLAGNKISDVSALKELKQLEDLNLRNNPDLTKAQIDQLQKALPSCKITPTPTFVLVGAIQSHDPQNDFYVINVGSDNGINKGDKFTIVRAGKEIGKIEISRTQPTVSIAVHQKGFPKPPSPFKSGDKVIKPKD